MKFKVLIDPQAKQDMNELFHYVAINDGEIAANKLLDNIEKTIYKLEKLPERGHIPPELRPAGIKNYLEIHLKPYRIIYEIENKEVIFIWLLTAEEIFRKFLVKDYYGKNSFIYFSTH